MPRPATCATTREAHMATTSLARAARVALRGRLGRRALRPPTARAVRDPSRPADEAAFAALVARHGPMVLGVCRQLLGDHHHAEDAFQAVFLVLAGKARSMREPDLLGNWLYGVAAAHGAQGPRPARPPAPDRGSGLREAGRDGLPPRRPIGASSTASRPRPCTARSTACRGPSACRWCSATSRASPSTRRRTGCDGPSARSAADWPAPARSSAAG